MTKQTDKPQCPNCNSNRSSMIIKTKPNIILDKPNIMAYTRKYCPIYLILPGTTKGAVLTLLDYYKLEYKYIFGWSVFNYGIYWVL